MQVRDKWVHFVMSQEELERMQQKMDELGIRNKSSYLRKMALDGYCVNLELDDVKEMVSLLRYCSNNLNQYAKRANETGSIYAEDIQDLQNRPISRSSISAVSLRKSLTPTPTGSRSTGCPSSFALFPARSIPSTPVL